MQPFDFLIPRRPVSLQTKNRKNFQAWKVFVQHQAKMFWIAGRPPVSSGALRCTIVYLCGGTPLDVDNIVKPIQDALVGVIFDDVMQISDVDSHRRFLGDPIDATVLPFLLRAGISAGAECVYVRISDAEELRSYL